MELDDTTSITKGMRRRGIATAKVMASAGRAMLGRTRAPDDARQARAAERLLVTLDEAKGFSAKIAQMLSYLDGALPESAQRVLARLQSDISPLPARTIYTIMQEELGKDVSEIFDAFDGVAIAAGTIAQVHRARLGERQLAVKIQYPGIREALATDLKLVSGMLRAALVFNPSDGPALAQELRLRIVEECDFLREAESQARFAQLLSAEPGVHVPGLVPELCTGKLLTMDFVAGQTFYEFASDASDAAREQAAKNIFSVCMKSIFHHCAFSADPHPGNYIFHPAGEVTFLDYGCVKRYHPTFVDNWKRMARSLFRRDPAAFREAVVENGLVGNVPKFDFQHQYEAMSVLYEPMLHGEPFLIDGDYLRRMNRALLFDNRNKHRLRLPPDWLYVNRLQWGLYSILSKLNVPVRWGELMEPVLDLPTQPLFQDYGV